MTDINLVHEIGDVLYQHAWDVSLGECFCQWHGGDHVDHQAQQVINLLRDLGAIV